MLIKLEGGSVYDPVHGIDGQRLDLWMQHGKIIAPPSDPTVRPERVIDLRGYVVMPGGIDMHCHIAGPKVNTGRKLRPEEKRLSEPVWRTATTRSGTMGSVPSTFATAYKYLGMGYTTAFDAAVPPLTARHAHEEFRDFDAIDRGFYVLVGNNHFAMRAIKDGDPKRLDAFLGWLLRATRGYALKLVNPGGVEAWKSRSQGNVEGLDDLVPGFDCSPRQILQSITASANRLGLPHPVHIHCNELGMPGNWRTTLETMQSLDGLRAHLTHIQFHSYAGSDADETTFGSRVTQLADYINRHPELTVDVGQVMFGATTSMTGDGPLGYYLSRLYGTKWFSGDTELEAGCGIAPIEYRNKSLVHALQWAIGLEWYLLVEDPWQVAMSTDHPNGGSFLAYPQIIRLLMDRAYRQEMIESLPAGLAERCVLPDLQREYSLYEICIITRSGPARMLGLRDKGHLGVGADADVTVYLPDENRQLMFELPRYVIQAGEVIVDCGELVATPPAATLSVDIDYDPAIEVQVADWFERDYSVRFRNYMIDDEEIERLKLIPTQTPSAQASSSTSTSTSASASTEPGEQDG